MHASVVNLLLIALAVAATAPGADASANIVIGTPSTSPITIGTGSGSGSAPSTPPSTPTGPVESYQQELLNLVNEHRRSIGAQPLCLTPTLNDAATVHSLDMAANRYMAHEGTRGESPFDRMRNTGYTGFTAAAENVAFASTGGSLMGETAQSAYKSWINSAGHRANIENPAYNQMGAARALGNCPGSAGGMQCAYWTQTFGTNNLNQYGCAGDGYGKPAAPAPASAPAKVVAAAEQPKPKAPKPAPEQNGVEATHTEAPKAVDPATSLTTPPAQPAPAAKRYNHGGRPAAPAAGTDPARSDGGDKKHSGYGGSRPAPAATADAGYAKPSPSPAAVDPASNASYGRDSEAPAAPAAADPAGNGYGAAKPVAKKPKACRKRRTAPQGQDPAKGAGYGSKY
ncbi:hypothetical protein H9P43_007882 [Blastocladiella emersonii ATCC 22665]|nr:hypothetical protein H9P43_007882 [Blastocladiella emersonii ATCC 22665]